MELDITGLDGLEGWIKKFEHSGELMLELSEKLASETVDLVKDGFDKESDTYGKKWLATARGGEILSDTGALKTSWKVKSATRAQFKVDGSEPYASFHQGGTKHMAARPMVPDGKLPASWLADYSDAADELFEEHFG